MKYRLLTDEVHYYVQYRPWWWPIWIYEKRLLGMSGFSVRRTFHNRQEAQDWIHQDSKPLPKIRVVT